MQPRRRQGGFVDRKTAGRRLETATRWTLFKRGPRRLPRCTELCGAVVALILMSWLLRAGGEGATVAEEAKL
jgi:hypothetical protein